MFKSSAVGQWALVLVIAYGAMPLALRAEALTSANTDTPLNAAAAAYERWDDGNQATEATVVPQREADVADPAEPATAKKRDDQPGAPPRHCGNMAQAREALCEYADEARTSLDAH
jgi:hypothetical protein